MCFLYPRRGNFARCTLAVAALKSWTRYEVPVHGRVGNDGERQVLHNCMIGPVAAHTKGEFWFVAMPSGSPPLLPSPIGEGTFLGVGGKIQATVGAFVSTVLLTRVARDPPQCAPIYRAPALSVNLRHIMTRKERRLLP